MLKRNTLLLFMAVGALLAWPMPAVAWHQDGHYAVARFAWNQLNDQQKASILKILKAHPHYDIYLKAECPKDVGEGEWAFVRASTWSDWVRSPTAPGLTTAVADAIRTAFNKGVWHYVDLPYIHPADKDKFNEADIRKVILLPELDSKGEPRHALAAIKLALKMLTAANSSDKDKAIYLSWLSHLTGDLHQPLHCTALIASKATLGTLQFDPPDGDRGGNQVAVKRKADDTEAVNLHFFWDALVFRTQPGFASVDAVVAKMRTNPKFQRDQLPELAATDPMAWAEEGLAIAKAVVYNGDDGFLKMTAIPVGGKVKAATRPYCRRVTRSVPRRLRRGVWSSRAIALPISWV